MDLMDDLLTTTDTFYRGRVIIQQPKKGYRFAVDSPILADFLPRSTRPALEIGCGVGVVSLLALQRGKFPAITGVEIQEPLYRLAVDNASANGRSEEFQVVLGDIVQVFSRFENVQTVFCNPPFFKTNQGHVSPDPSIRLARSDVALTLDNLLRCAQAILAPRGRLFLIFPFSRQHELLETAAVHGLHPEKIRCVRPFADAAPDRFLARLGKSRVSCREEPPLVIFKSMGSYRPEMEKILSGA
jgi:tRNA1Val (adenine37-N6)-methyltransferase